MKKMNPEKQPHIVLPIGVVRSRFSNVEGMPIQSAAAYGEAAIVEIFAEFEDGLQGVDGFEYLFLITHLHQVQNELLVVKPFLDECVHGVFATRAPARPNKIGISIVKLLKREGLILHIDGNDMLDGTPVIDIKPYVPDFDNRQTKRIGWYETKINRFQDTKADNRMNSQSITNEDS